MTEEASMASREQTQDREPFSPRFSSALAFAADLHREQTRKGTDIPYIAHLLAVAALVIEHGGDEDQAIAALLHDAVEDQGGQETLAQIRQRYGERVAGLVDACTDSYEKGPEKAEWKPRKEKYLASLPGKPSDALLVSAADKLHNATAILEDYLVQGEALWSRFNGGRQSLWYYRGLVEGLRHRTDPRLHRRLEATVDELERLAGEAAANEASSGTAASAKQPTSDDWPELLDQTAEDEGRGFIIIGAKPPAPSKPQQ